MATLKDVAEKVGVSITTVSRVMNGRGAISRETRDKVFAAMKELNYFPNEILSSRNLVGELIKQRCYTELFRDRFKSFLHFLVFVS